jgi:hypothetical protein
MQPAWDRALAGVLDGNLPILQGDHLDVSSWLVRLSRPVDRSARLLSRARALEHLTIVGGKRLQKKTNQPSTCANA